jgi:hypothetical protein
MAGTRPNADAGGGAAVLEPAAHKLEPATHRYVAAANNVFIEKPTLETPR